MSLTLHFAPSDDPASKYIRTRPPHPNSLCEDLFTQVRHCIVECRERHGECRSKLPTLPTRVLDVGILDGSQEPYLLITNGMQGEYITLSYCWGNSPAVKTKVADFQDHCKEIKCHLLPKTIQDAIHITRKLGFRYLWVDALCIIQDSPNGEDWVIESAKMARIYGDSFLTIAAELANNSSHGIFCERPPQKGVKVPFDQNGIASGHVFLQKVDIKSSLEPSPLSTRAWTFQEREMARRILQYDRESVSFRCKRGTTGETEGFSHSDTGFTRLFNWLDDRGSLNTLEDALDKWYGFALKYSPREMTFENDKLPAISGLAHEMQNTIRGRYLAGLWECDLLYGLTWRSHRHSGDVEGSLKARRRQGRGPTWSWASVNGAVGYETLAKPSMIKENSMKVASLRMASINPLTLDPMGRVSTGTIVIDGPLRLARWDTMRNWSRKLHTSHLLLDFDVLLAVEPAELGCDYVGSSLPLAASTEVAPFACCIFDDDTERPGQVWCLLLQARQGIMLQRTGSRDMTYRRVGYFELDGEEAGWEGGLSSVEII
jgi:Heterokaryon incompatibility protein (HET)